MKDDWDPTCRLPQAARPGMTRRQARVSFGCAFLAMPLGLLSLSPTVVLVYIALLGLLVLWIARHQEDRGKDTSDPSTREVIARNSWLWRFPLLVVCGFAEVWYFRSAVHPIMERSLGAPFHWALMLVPLVALLLGRDWYVGVIPALTAGALLVWAGVGGATAVVALFSAVGASLILSGLAAEPGLNSPGSA